MNKLDQNIGYNLGSLLTRLWRHLPSNRKRQFFYLVGLIILSSFAEIVSIGAIIPFLGILIAPEIIFKKEYLKPFVDLLNIKSAQELLLPLSFGFVVAASIAGFIRLKLLKSSIWYSNITGTDLSVDIYKRTLYQPYSIHISRSTNEILSGITQKVGSATSILISIISMITSSLLFLSILLTLFVVDPFSMSVLSFTFGLLYLGIALKARRKLFLNSKSIAIEQTKVIKALQEGLGAIRDILLDNTQEIYCKIYEEGVHKLREASSENTYMNQSPRYMMEAVGIVIVTILAYLLNQRPGGVGTALPVLGALALGAQRLLPLLQTLYGSWSVIVGNQVMLGEVLVLLEQPLPDYSSKNKISPYNFSYNIEFKNVYFRYNDNSPYVLENINFLMKKGSRIGLVGETGSGKSTTLDLLMSLAVPTHGEIRVDGKPIQGELGESWKRSIAHVPQHIFLSDSSIAENIAFGIPFQEIDMERVKVAAEQARIDQFIMNRPDGYHSNVGERGIRLSGGQRQRIGIARALYKQAKVLVFDEATSALDNDTERAVMEAIDELGEDLTIILIAHRLSTVKNCDKIILLSSGKIVKEGTFDQLFSDSNFESRV